MTAAHLLRLYPCSRLAVVVLVSVIPLAAQSAQKPVRPDFSGSWTLQSGAGGYGGQLVFSNNEMTIVQTKTTITVKKLHGQNPVSISLPLSGEEVTITLPPLKKGLKEGPGALTMKSRVEWHDAELVVHSVQHFDKSLIGPFDLEDIESLTLVEPGFLVVHRTYDHVAGPADGIKREQDIYKRTSRR